GRQVGSGFWVTVCTSTASPLVCTYDTATIADGQYEVQLIVTDNAGNTTTTPIVTPINVDNTDPTVTMTNPGTPLGGVDALSSTTGDASGIATVLYQYKTSAGAVWNTACSSPTTPFTCNFDTASVPDGLYDFRAIATDLAGNQVTSGAVTNRRIDNTAPTAVTITAPPTPIRGTITINAGTPADTGGSGIASVAIQRSPAGAGTWTSICTDTTAAYSSAFDSTTVTDGLYDFRALATDNAGNTTASAEATNRRVDNTAPAVALTNPGTPLRATVVLNGTASDGGSGLASLAFQRSPAGAGVWTTICTGATSPATCSFNTTALNGTFDIRALATDVAGNQSNSTVTNIVIDNTAPTATNIQTANVGTLGRPNANDTVTDTVSEQMLTTSILAGWAGASTPSSVRLTQGATDTMTIWNAGNTAQLPLGSVTIGTGHVTASAVLNATMVRTGSTVVITLGTLVSGTVATSATNVTMVWTPSATATDLAGNAMSTTTRTETGGNDR
ncbi:MAG: Ig-like domain-containing protein, partial [Actinomycetota bacterium]|nr:Ig-like domain-containing protein [Actinomycetota bacterium]